MSVDTIRRMNELGAAGEPFLFIIDFEMRAPLIFPLKELTDGTVLYTINGRTNSTASDSVPGSYFFHKHPLPYDEYLRAFQLVQHHLHAGNSYLVNLTMPTRIETSLRLEEIYYGGVAQYKLLFRNEFVVFSPECFIRIRDGKISSFPMKGTIKASHPSAAETLLSDPKEGAEHNTIVDLIRNDLSIIARNVRVERFRYLDHIHTHEHNLLQMSSTIIGHLPDDYPSRIGTILFALLPAGSVSGAPKKKTVEIIRKAEKRPRGYYTGICGYFDGETLDSGVMIRYIERSGDALFYRSGGGITSSSNPESEYQELLDKVYVPFIRNH